MAGDEGWFVKSALRQVGPAVNCLFPGNFFGPGGPDDDAHRRGALMGLVIVGLLIIVGLGLMHVLKQAGDVQDCAMQGRTNCVQVP